jgi:uncharacterized cupin superfamily protein
MRGSGYERRVEPGVSFTKLDFAAGERFVRLRNTLGVDSFGLNLLLLEPGQGSRIHRHERQEEVYVVLEGTLTLEYDGERHELGQGDVARVAPDVKRQLSNRTDQRLALLAVGGATPHVGRDGMAYLAWDDDEAKQPADVPLPENLRD